MADVENGSGRVGAISCRTDGAPPSGGGPTASIEELPSTRVSCYMHEGLRRRPDLSAASTRRPAFHRAGAGPSDQAGSRCTYTRMPLPHQSLGRRAVSRAGSSHLRSGYLVPVLPDNPGALNHCGPESIRLEGDAVVHPDRQDLSEEP